MTANMCIHVSVVWVAKKKIPTYRPIFSRYVTVNTTVTFFLAKYDITVSLQLKAGP